MYLFSRNIGSDEWEFVATLNDVPSSLMNPLKEYKYFWIGI